MTAQSRLGSFLLTLLAIAVLTVLFYLPVWVVVGLILYPHTHPDFWDWAIPEHILPVSGLISTIIALSTKWIFSRR